MINGKKRNPLACGLRFPFNMFGLQLLGVLLAKGDDDLADVLCTIFRQDEKRIAGDDDDHVFQTNGANG